MCKRVEASRKEAVIVFTCSPPFSKGKPGYVSMRTGATGDVIFTESLWEAWAQKREDWVRWLPSLKARCKHDLYTHAAVAMLVTPT